MSSLKCFIHEKLLNPNEMVEIQSMKELKKRIQNLKDILDQDESRCLILKNSTNRALHQIDNQLLVLYAPKIYKAIESITESLPQSNKIEYCSLGGSEK